MSRSLMLILLGVAVALTPFFGVPQSIMVWIVPPLGVVIACIGLSYKQRIPKKFDPDTHDEA